MLVWRNGIRGSLKSYCLRAWGFKSLYQHQEMKETRRTTEMKR